MMSFYERFRDRIDMADGTVVLTEAQYNAIVSEVSLESERRVAALEEKLERAESTVEHLRNELGC